MRDASTTIKVFNRQKLLIGEFRNVPNNLPKLVKWGTQYFQLQDSSWDYQQIEPPLQIGMLWLIPGNQTEGIIQQ